MTTTVVRRRAVAAETPTRAAVRTRRAVTAGARREAAQDAAAARKPRRSAVTQNLKEREEVQELLKDYADLSAHLDELATELQAKAVALQKLYDDHGLNETITGYGFKVYMKATKGRASTEVDIDALYEYFDSKDDMETFWSVVSAKVTDVKKVVPEKEQNKVMTTVEGKDGDPVFAIEKTK